MILQTVPAVLCGSNGNSMVVRCFLDSGSQTSFIKQNVIEQLGLDGPSVRISVSGFGGKQDKACLRKSVSCTLAPVDRPRCSREFEALTTSEICHPAEAVEINPVIYSHLKDVKFPEEFPREQKPIDVLIGLDFYYSFVTRDVVKAEPSEPVAVRTVLGWVLCGPTSIDVLMNIHVSGNDQLNETLQAFWNLESIGIEADDEPLLNRTEETVLNNFKESLTIKDGRYEVSIPWKED